jgi:hypothetical protein
MAGASLRESAASQHGRAPAHRNGGASLSGTQQSPADRRVRVRITSFADRLDQRIFNWRTSCEVTERILKCNDDPTLVMREVIWAMTELSESQAFPNHLGLRILHSRFCGRQHRFSIAATNGGRDRRDESCRRRLAYWVRVA